MAFIIKYDKRAIMNEAYKFFRGNTVRDFGTCLRMAWDNAKGYKALTERVGEPVNTWFGWTLLGREVKHNEVNVGQYTAWDDSTKSGRRTKSYFTYGQTCELGTQPPKA